MRRTQLLLMTLILVLSGGLLQSEEAQAPFQSFTGKVHRNRVRMRMQPNLDSPIIRELDHGEMVLVVGKAEDFYAIEPPKATKAYVSRRYVLDGIVEGNHVNVRLEPSLESPVIAQLNTGDEVEGVISALNSKWLEISIPDSVHFYVSDDFIEKVGDPNYMATQEYRRDEVNRLLSSTYAVSQTELQKPFNEVDLEGVYRSYAKVIKEYQDFPDQVGRARELMTQAQEKYLQKKIAYLEAKSKTEIGEGETLTRIEEQQQIFQDLEQQLEQNEQEKAPANYADWTWEQNPSGNTGEMAGWIPKEKMHYEEWLIENRGKTFEDFYEDQRLQSVVLSGILQPYQRSIRNKPGDYVLLHRLTRLPIAYLYSTQVNLKNRVGKDVSVRGALRPNNNFAYPAYFVLEVE